MPDAAPMVVDYGAFQQPPSRLFRDYLAGAEAVRPFFDGGRWDLDALAAAAGRTLDHGRRREALAAALARQQQELGTAAGVEAARRLAEPGATAVVTGQQAGLFGGPLYVLYKALAAVHLASLLEQRCSRPVVPVFWVASDDHDFAEVRSTAILDEAGRIRTVRYSPVREPAGEPASRIVLDDTIAALVQELARAIPPGLHRDEALGVLGACYRPGVTLAGAFARFLAAVVPGLVVLDPSDPALKALMAPVMAREIRDGSPTSRLAAEVGERLLASGYHQQVPVRPGFLNLFLMAGAQRRALASLDGVLEVRGPGSRIPVDEALRMLEAEPEAWSPGVLLRPLAQDDVLPTAAYVGGPAEIAYHAQIGPSYAAFGVPRPALVPRPSITLVEPAQARALEAEDLSLADLQADPERLVARWAREAYPEVEGAFGRAREALEKEMGAVEEVLGGLDPTLRAAADAARGRALHQIEALHEKSVRALKKRDRTRAERLRRTRDALLPGGSFQERGLGLVWLLARHGLAVAREIRGRMDPWATGHQVVTL